MKKTTFLKVILLAFMFLQSFLSISQNVVPFTRRFDRDIKGDMLLIGNSILNRRSATRNPNDPYNGNNLNSDFSMEYINIDNGATPGIFNSSSANLVVPNPVATSAPCYKIVYAALYWGAVTKGTTPVTNIKFKMPSGGYNDVVGTVIHNSTTLIGTSLPYACVADVTSLVTGTGNPNPEGTYTVANVSTAQGINGGTGLSAGWSLYIVYEDPKLPAKSITSFDGFSAISSTVNLDIPVSGFRTIPTGPVRAKFAFSALEGDQGINGDYLAINGSILSAVNNAGTTIRGTNNFFNSSVTFIDPVTNKTEDFLNRTPNSSNTLGYDAGILEINNNGNAIIKNNDISATINLRSSQDIYFYYFNAIALDIIAPNIVLTKQVFSDATLTNDIGNQNVTLGQELFYAIGFQNIGNDNADNFTIKDVLPININFDPSNIIIPNGSGITYTYTASTRTIIFTIPKNLVEVKDPRYIIRFKVKVVPECNDLSDACSDKIQNTAFATYDGVTSGIKVDDQQSLATFGACFLGTPAPTNFLVGTENCVYTKEYQLCGATVVLTAANGYNAYSWSTSPSGTPVIGTTQSITVSQTGTYYVTNFAIAPCRTIKQVVTVKPAGSAVSNPVIPFADQVVTCTNNGKLLPKIFLCGANASKLITTGASDATSIQWQRLNEASCPAVGSDDCANEQTSCTWTTVATGSNYTADTSGQYRVVFNYAGGCFNIFYFNVFKNLLNPTAVSRDIYCTTIGQITVGGVPATGYEFSLNATGPFQTSNVFPISTPGTYTVYIRQQGIATNPCLFSVPGIDIVRRNFTVSEFVTQPLCNGDRGLIKLAANDVRAQYFYTLKKNGTIVNSVGPIAASDFDFPNLTAGMYTYEVRTDDGCLGTGSIEIKEPAILTATVNQTKALTCETGEVTVTPVGGTTPYSYYVNGATSPQFSNVINTPTAGLYQIVVVDFNGCRTTTSINVASVPKPVYNTVGTNVNCYGDTTGVINFNMTADNGYTVTYSIDNGLKYGTSGLISGLAAGTYNTILKYTLNGVECLDTMVPITITQPSTALTASAGVSELAGCGPAGEGRVRITNVQGGVAPYEFSFDNQGSWTTVNNALKAPGNYILYVRDRNNCIFQAPVTVDPAPATPNINVGTPVDFNCDGTATSIVTVNNPGNINYTYNYFIDGVQNPNTPSNIFLNVTPGPHAIRIDYQLSTVTTFSNLLNEDFGIGANTTTPGIAAAYCFHNLDVVPSTCPNPLLTLEDNQYVVTRGLVPNNPAWFPFRDHTTAGANPNGRFLAVNIGGAAGANGVLYSKVINDIIPNQPVIVEAYVANLFRANFVGSADPSFSFELVDSSGNVVAQQPPIPPTPNPTGIPPIPTIPRSDNWVLRSVSLNPGNNTSLTFRVRSGSTEISGNDAAIDDIRVYQLPKACITSRTIDIQVPTGRAFEAQVTGQRNVSCAGGADGGFTITAQNFDATTGFEYSLNNGGAWSAVQLTSPVVINTLGVNSYNVLVRPVGSTVTACSKSFTVNITAPAAVTAAATILTPATCTTGATIRATGGGGTPAYQYELRATNGTTVITAFNTSRDFTNVPAGDYTVFVKDANGCTNPTGVAVSVLASPAVNAVLANTTDYCYTTADPATLVVNVSGGTGPFTYQLDSNAGVSSVATTYSFSNVGPGTHTILVTDSNNCTSTISNVVIAPQIGFNVTLINDLTCLANASIGNPVVTSGNGTPYTYTVSYNSGTPTAVTSFPYTATQAGSYVFTVTDSRGCPATSNPIVVTPKTTPTHITAKTDITCNGLNNGTITVTPSGGFTTTYTYAIKLSTVTTYTTQATNQFTGLAAGIYDIKVIDSKGCESTPTQVTIINPTPIVPNASATAFSCSTTNAPQSATITVAPTGGTGTYTYSYNNGGSFGPSNTLTVNDNGTTQTIQIVVKDANGCLSPMQAIVLAPLNKPTDLTFLNAAVTCTATTTTVSVTATNGVGALSFLITATNSGTAASNFGPITTAGSSVAANFPNLLPGNYTFRVTDANGCYYTESHNIDPVTPIAVAANKTSDVLCQGGSTGSGTYTISGNATVGAYTFTLTAGTLGTGTLTKSNNVLTLSNVGAGTYTVRVTDTATGCFADGTITINQPALPLTMSITSQTNFNCNNDNAQITVSASGGTTAYGYAAVPATPVTVPTTFASSNVVTVDTNNGTVLNWVVFVRDANGCTTSTPVTIAGDPAPAAPVVTVPNQCSATGSGFTITVTPVSGPLSPYTYGIAGTTGAFQTANTFNVAPGTYTVYVKDKNGCVSTGTAVTVAAQLTANAAVTKTLDCTGTPNAVITTTISGGKAPFTYTVQKGTGTPSAPSAASASLTFTTSVSNANADLYTFVITDANGCPTTTSATVAPITNPTVAVASQVNVSCTGGNDGSVTLAGSGGSGGYTYSNNASSGYTATATFGGLTAAGSPYTFYVRDNKGCQNSVVVTISQPTTIATNATSTTFSCSTTNAPQSATITVAPTGGTGTYTYSYNNGGSFGPSNTLTVNDNGTTQTIQIVVKDANGCLSPMQAIVLAPLNKPTDLTFLNAAVTCTATTTTVSVTATNGVGALSFLITGTNSGTAASNFGPITTTGSSQAASFPNLLPGNYTFRVTDANGCYYTESHNIDPVTPIAVAANKTSDVLCQGGTTGSGTYTISGNATVGAYTFTLTAGTLGTGTLTKSNNVLTLSNVGAGTYTVRVTDTATGCFADGTITINQPALPLTMSITSQTNFNCNNDNAQITVSASGGTTAYGYAAVPATPVTVPTTFASSNVVTVDTNNGTVLNWVVFVRDANGCTTSTPVTIAGDPAPAAPVVTVPNQCSATGSGFTITVTPVSGPLSPYTYGIAGTTGAFQTANTFNVAPGTYTVYVKDKNGCVSTGTAVTVAAQLTANAAVTKTLDCTGTPNAVITTTISGGKAPFTYTVQKGTGTPSAPSAASASLTFTTSVSNANADLYTFVITDANGCPTTTSATVAPITNPTVAVASQVNVSCTGGNDGSVTLAGSGGSGGYTYSNNASSGYTATATFGGLTAAGSPYTFYVRDNKGCQNSVVVTITQPANALAATVTEVPFSCSPSNTKVSGTVTINVTVGTGTSPYTYSFNGGAFTSNNVLTLNDNGSNQPYTYAVQDAKGCPISGSGTLLPLNNPVIGTITSTPIYCAPAATTSTVTVPVNAGTGVGTLSYTIVSGPVTNTSGATTGVFSGLTSGNYVFRVTDANGCYDTESYFVAPVTPIVATATKLTDVDCFGNTTGSIRYTVSGFGTGSYSYTINGVATATGQTAGTFDLTNRAAGTYAVVFTDDITSCTATTSVTITQPAQALAATYTTVNANCNVPTASVTVTPTGGTANYRYSFVTSSTIPGAYGTNNIANLNPTTSTTWFAHIIDANNCTFILPITIATDPIPTVTATATGQCLGSGSYTITALGSGGVGTLSYSINGGASYQAGNTFTVTTSGNYTITVKDANNCTSTSNVITVAPQLTLNASLNKDITCNPAPTDAQITLTPTGGVGPFTYTASPATGTFSGAIFTTNAPGSYTFTVTDTTTGCTYTTTAAIPVTVPVNPVIDDVALPGPVGVTQTAFINCNGDDTAAIAIAIDNTQGQSPFVFNVQRTAPTVQNYGTQTSGLSAGDYLITVTDAKGCTDTETITINEPPAIIVTSTSTPITCNGAGISKGSVIVQSVTGGVGPYNYFVTGVNGYNNSELNNLGTTSVAFNVVDFGIYQINVVDFNGCSVLIQNVKVASPPDDLDISVIPPPADCSAPGSAVISVGSSPTSTIGAGPFYFSIYTGSATVYPAGTWLPEDAPGSKQTTFPNLIPGVTYTFVVFDADVANGGTGTGCYYYETSTIPIPTNSTITVNPLTPNNITCRGAGDGNVTFTMNQLYGVATPVTYQIYNSQSVTPVGPAVAAVIPATGSLVVNNFGTLPFGSYFVLVTETGVATNSGCSITSTRFDITESAIDLTITAQKIKNINCNEDGIIAAFASNGTGPYTYQYLLDTVTAPTAGTSGWVTNTTFATSVPGNYIVYVKDNYGCIKSDDVILLQDAPPSISLPASICYNGTPFTINLVTDASASATILPATYKVEPIASLNTAAYQNGSTFTFNAAGTYRLYIKDGNGCVAFVDYTVLPQLQLQPVLTKVLDCNLPTPNATVTVTATGGTAAYAYTIISGPVVNTTGATTGIFTGLDAGNYTFGVNDGACTATTTFTIDPIPATIIATPVVKDVSCNGGSDGTITVTVTSGEGPYTYVLSGTTTNTSGDASGVYTGLPVGNYVVTVRNGRGCLQASPSIPIAQPTLLTATATAAANTTCSTTTVITVTASQGTPSTVGTGYTYSFNGLSYTSDNTFTVNNGPVATTTTISVKDANGCTLALPDVITPALTPPTNLTFAVTTAPTCPANTATVQVTATGGLGSLDFDIIEFNNVATTLYPTQSTAGSGTPTSFANLPPGDYIFRVTDDNGCTYQELYTVVPVTPIAIVGALVNDITCNPANGTTNNGSARFTVTGFSSTGNYSINVTSVPALLPFTQLPPVGDVITLTGLNAGTYTVTVTDNTTLCLASDAVTITLPNPIAFTTAATKVFCTQDISQITVSAVTGGSGAYQYAVLPGGTVTPPAMGAYNTNPVLSVDTNLTALSWDVYVMDAKGCVGMQNVTVVSNAAPTIVAPAAQCYTGSPLTADLSPNTITTTYNGVKAYTLNGTALTSSIATFNGPGTYVLGIKDDNGCEAFVNYTITNQLIGGAVLVKDLTCSSPTAARVDVTISGGIAPFTVQTLVGGIPTGAAATGVTGPIYTVNPTTVGIYSFVITDSNPATCSVTTNTVEVTTPVTPTFTAVATDATCNGDSNGTITVTPTAGVAPFTFALSGTGFNTTGDATGNYSGLPAGSYTVVITDAKGCQSVAAAAIDINQPFVVSATISVTTPLSCGTGNATQAATVTAVPSGGNGSYQYNFNNQGFTTNNTFVTNTAGPVSVIVRDTNGCSFATAVGTTVIALDPPTNMDISGSLIYCAPATSTTSTVTINTVSNGVLPFTYQMLSPSSINNGPSNSFAGLAAGDYMFQVTDANGCTYQELYTVAPRVNISIVGALVNDITCNPANGTTNNGSASFTVTSVSSVGGYSVSVVPPVPFTQSGNTVALTGLAAGTFTVTVTDNTTLCAASDAVTITLPNPIAFTTAATKVFCTQDISQITVSAVTGGSGAYQYAVLPGGTVTPPVMGAYNTNPVLSVDTNLTALSWDVYVMDAKGCVGMQNVTVVSNAAPTIVAPAAQCYTGTPLTADLSPNTITTTYNGVKAYTLNGTALTSSIATFNGPGTYVLGIKDDNGCEAFVNYTITNQLIGGAVLVKDLTCSSPTAARVDVTISGGIAPFTVQTLVGGIPTGAAATGVTGPIYTVNPTTVGIYSFVITDSNPATCSVTTNTVEVTTPVTPTFTAVATDATCNGDSNGTITVTPTAGVAPFTFALSGTGFNTTGDATGNYSGLPAGSYTVVITDAKGCQSAAATAIVINQPFVVSATISVTTPLSCGTGNATQAATVTAVPSGGNGSYQYNFNNQGFTTNNTFVTNTAGPVSVIVRDTNGCSFATAVGTTVIALDPPTNMDISGSLIYCAPATSTTSTVLINSVTNGVGPFTYQMVSPSVINNFGSNSFAGLAAGDYMFQVTDANGCTYQELYTVAPRVNIAATVATITNETCFNANNGTATFTVSNSAGYTATLTVGTGSPVIAGNTVSLTALVPGNYNLQVVDTTTGCTADVPFTIVDVAQVLDFNSTATNINCNVDTATITVMATGGTPDYKYAVALATAPAPAVTAYGLSNSLVVDTNNGADMNWIVYVMDANGCPINKPQTISLDANPTIASAVATQCPSATGTYNITVTASGFSPALEYSADGSNYQSGNVITVNAPGNYNITVRDANGCISAATVVSIVNPLILTPVVSIPVSCTGGDGQITVSTTGGSGNFVYNIDGAPFAAVTAFNAVAAGNHIIGVRDTTTLCEVFVPVNLQAATLVTGFALAKTDVTCNGGNDGTITASFDTPAPGINDNPVYLYSLNSGLPQASNVFSNLVAGTYTVRVISSRGCDATASITINQPGLITVPAPTVVQFGCVTGNTGNLATITVTGVTGGSGTYLNYEFLRNGTRVQFGNSNVYTETVLTGGNYTVNVFDNRGCVGSTTTPITIAPYVALDAVSVTVNRPITCAVLENITVSVTTIGGTATNLEYTIVYKDPITGALTGLYPTTTNTDGIFTNLPIGDYNITVRNLDTNCEIRAVHFVNNPNTFDLVVNATTDVTCLNDTNGTATITLVDRLITTTPVNGNDAGPFSYTLQNAAGLNVGSGTATNAGPITLTGLAAGTYTISATLSQTPDCTVTTNFTIAAPATALDITETHTEITCVTGNNDGSISVAATGGWPGSYQFELVGPTPAQSVAYGTQTVFTGLTAGSYTVNVRDSKGCVNSEIVVLNNPTLIAFVAVPSTTLVSCINDTSATITVTTGPTGGSGSYLYTLIRTDAGGVVTTSGPQSANTFNNLGAGTYQVRVSDSWSCATTSSNIVINEPTRVTAALALATAKTCATNARLTLTAAGGTAPYTYSTTPNFATATIMVGNTATFSVPVGTHSYYIRDNNGCVSFISNDVKIEEVPTLTLALDVQNATINCTGDASGVIVALAQGGLGNYVYTLLDSTGNPVPFTVTQTTPGNFTNIPAGNYVVRVVSQDCAAVTSSIVPITEPLVALTQSYVVTPITCAGEGDGRIVITASGGTGIIKYAISPRLDQFFESGVFENLRPGFYEYIVQDENGCFINIKDIEITEPGSVFATVIPNSAVPEVCAGDADGAFSINITGGNAPYSVSLNNRNGTYTTGTLTQTQFDFSGLSGNEQIVYIRDANGCESDISVMLGEPVTLNPVADVNYDCVNNSQVNSVTITVAAGNVPADLDYSLDGSLVFQTSNVFNNLSAGRHTVDVRHTNGCIKQVIFNVDQINPITISLSDGGLNEIVSTVSGGFGNYQYSLNGEPQGSQGNFIIYKSGDYTVTVTDANGCSATATRYFEFIDIKIPNVFTPNGDGNNDTWAPTNTINYKDLIFEVFDRYGRKIGTYREGQSWNGKYNGNELPSGDYWYILRLRNVQDAREFVGHFTLYR